VTEIPLDISVSDTVVLDGVAMTVADIDRREDEPRFQMNTGGMTDTLLTPGELADKLTEAQSIVIHR
jgi:hypothetical protein